ncbi:hypothetical protein [Catellatospora sp. NPDC049609]|uniref:hypothetical protein n=1 Tax=Catellatospora sp. NPDC049609 TaxID=3155505 RepID=UPI00341C3652
MTAARRLRLPAGLPVTRAIALFAALSAAGAMLTLDPRQPPAPPRTGDLTLAEAYAGARVQDTPGTLPDGAAYTPMFFLDSQRSVGTAQVPGGTDVRLLLRSGDGLRELRRMPQDQAGEFAGFTSDGAELVWVELSSDPDGSGRTRIWAARLDGGAARVVTEDTGAVMLFDKQGDLTLHDGRVSWMADSDREGWSALRTVPLTGGVPEVRELPGGYAISTWPWLVSESAADAGEVTVHNVATGQRTVVGVRVNELLSCSHAWCRSIVIGSTEASTAIELARPDGSDRTATISGAVSSAVADVALLDRFEIYTRSSPILTSSRLLLYDLSTRTLTLVSDAAGRVAARGGVLWWSTGDNETLIWHALDLREL